MDTGKILIGFAFILLSVALMVSPSSAEMQGLHGDDGFMDAWSQGQITAPSPALPELPAAAEPGLERADLPVQNICHEPVFRVSQRSPFYATHPYER